MNIYAQILGLLGLVFAIWSIQQNKKRKLLEIQLVSNILYGFQYLLLSAWSATCMSGISFFRSLIFYNDSKHKKKTSMAVLIVFMVITITLGVTTFDGYYSLIPVVITMMYTYAVWQNKMTIFRNISIIVAICWIYYNYKVGAYIAIIGSAFELTSSIIAIIRYDNKIK